MSHHRSNLGNVGHFSALSRKYNSCVDRLRCMLSTLCLALLTPILQWHMRLSTMHVHRMLLNVHISQLLIEKMGSTRVGFLFASHDQIRYL
jgi:hypothetical protein